jgi:hypothetical protein
MEKSNLSKESHSLLEEPHSYWRNLILLGEANSSGEASLFLIYFLLSRSSMLMVFRMGYLLFR